MTYVHLFTEIFDSVAQVTDVDRAETDDALIEKALDHARALLHSTRELSAQTVCLPIDDSVRYQELAQKAWNLITVRRWPSATHHRVKAVYRHVVTVIFLAGNSFYAPDKVRNNYFATHRMESEKCVVMCLKTAKDLSRVGCDADAKDLLESAVLITQCGGLHSKLPHAATAYLPLEISFARFAVLWNLNHYTDAVSVCKLLRAETRDSRVYREELLQLIFTMGENPQSAQEGEIHLRELLTISLDMQGVGSSGSRSQKQRALSGCTRLQIASSFLRSNLCVEAAAAAGEAYAELESLEPLIIQLKAYAGLKNTEMALDIFSTIVHQSAGISTAEMFTLGTQLLDASPTLYRCVLDRMKEVCVTRTDAATPGEFNFRLVCFMLHASTDASVLDACQAVASGSSGGDDGAYQRFFFCSLWSTATSEATLSARTRLEALHTCLHLNKQASEEEICAVLVDMAALACAQLLINSEVDTQCIQRCLEAYRQYFPVIRSAEENIYCLMHKCQLHYLVGEDSEGMCLVKRLLLRSPSDVVLGSCGFLINYFQSAGRLPIAASIAHAVVTQSVVSLTAADRLDFLRVCFLGTLSSPAADVDVTLLQTLIDPIITTLQEFNAQEGGIDYLWWCKCLWYVADIIVDKDPAQAVTLSNLAVTLLKTNNTAEEQLDTKLLINRCEFTLSHEFDMYVCGGPTLSTADITLLEQLLGELGASTASSDFSTRVAFLSRAEVKLRDLPSGILSEEHVQSIVDLTELSQIGISSADQEALSAAVLREAHVRCCAELRSLAVRLQLSAVDSFLSDDAATAHDGAVVVAKILMMFFKCYEMADSADQQLLICSQINESVIKRFLNLKCAAEYPDSNNDSVADQVAALLSFFCIESWNAGVRSNALRDREATSRWLSLAVAFSDTLSPQSTTRVTITGLLAQMPVM